MTYVVFIFVVVGIVVQGMVLDKLWKRLDAIEKKLDRVLR